MSLRSFISIRWQKLMAYKPTRSNKNSHISDDNEGYPAPYEERYPSAVE